MSFAGIPMESELLGIELAAMGGLMLFLVWFYSGFLLPLYRFATAQVGLAVLLVFAYAMVFAQVGSAYGIPYLFWHEDFLSRLWASAGATLLLAVVGVVAYYLDPFPWATDRRTAAWLAPDEAIKARLEAGWRRKRTGTPDATVASLAIARARAPRAGFEVDPPRLRWWNWLVFGANSLIDPISILPPQAWLEPTRSNQVRLQRFLRTCRTPFLLLLLAPAVFPHVFSNVPGEAPTGGLEWAVAATLDIRRNVTGYLLGVAAWLLGIDLGVLIIKFLIRASEVLYLLLPSETEVDAAPGPDGRIAKDPRCAHAADGGCPGGGCPRGLPTHDDRLSRHRVVVRWIKGIIAGSVVALVAMGVGIGNTASVSRLVSPILFFVVTLSTVAWALLALPGRKRWTAPDVPPRCRASQLRRVSILVFVLLFLVTYALMGVPDMVGANHVLTPALAICAALSLGAMVLSIVAFLPQWGRAPVVVALIVWLIYANNDPFKNRFPGMPYEKPQPADLRDRVNQAYFPAQRAAPSDLEKEIDPPLVPDADALANWAIVAGTHGKAKPKLVVLAVSGGATRSAFWAATVVSRLERTIPGFGHHVRIITGASGGMLGMAYYVNHRRDVAQRPAAEQGAVPPTGWADAMPFNSLQPVARDIALKEIWRALWPYAVPVDRGIILETNWSALRYPLSDLRDLELAGKIPSIIFSPMMIEDGRQLLISNLDLGQGKTQAIAPTVMTQGRDVSYNSDGRSLIDVSLPAVELFRMFPQARSQLQVATAVRMNSSFPYVSPAVNLPSDPPQRVVDAGYYDNYGIQVASAWIRQNHDDLSNLTSGVLLVQIRDSLGDRERLDVNDAPPTPWQRIMRGSQFVTSPIDGLMEARSTSSAFRNDADVEALHGPFAPDQTGTVADSHAFYSTIIFENSAGVTPGADDFWHDLSHPETDGQRGEEFREVSMTWYLTRAEQAAIRRAIPKDLEPGSPWLDDAKRQKMLEQLQGQVFVTKPKDELAKLSEAQKQDQREKGKLCYPPGAARDLAFKRLEQLRNYERLQSLKRWWANVPK